MKRQLFGVFLALCMAIAFLFVPTLAAETESDAEARETPMELTTTEAETSEKLAAESSDVAQDLKITEEESAILASDIVASGECGDKGGNVTWTLDSEGKLTISGVGKMKTYNSNRPPWYKNPNIKNVSVQYGVTSISEHSTFEGCSGLTSVSIPNSVTFIGNNAFLGCSRLTSVTIPDSVTFIGNGAFGCCDSLRNIYVSEANQAYTSQNGVLFDKAKAIILAFPAGKTDSYYAIPDGVVSIAGSAFAGCKNLKDVVIPYGVTRIENNAFNGCYSLTTLTIPNSVTSIEYHAFQGCSGLTSVTIPDSVISIEYDAFENCSGLTSVTIPNSVVSIGDCAFGYCSGLKNVDISNCLTFIGGHAFRCCGLTSVSIPNGVPYISRCMFYDCSSLTSVTIPTSVTEIGEYAFYGCYNLKDVYYAGSEAQWNAITLRSVGNGHLKGAAIHYNSGGESQNGLGRSPLPADWTSPALRITRFVNPARNINKPDYMLDGVPFYEICVGNRAHHTTLMMNVTERTSYTLYSDSNCTKEISDDLQLKAGNNLVYIKLERIYLSAEKPERVTTCYGVNIVREKTASEDANEIEDRTVIYTSSLAEVGQKNVYLTVPWGWNLFKGNSTVFDERLAFVSLTLSRAAEDGQDTVEGLLRDYLGFSPDFQSLYYDRNLIKDITHPAHTFGHAAVMLNGVRTNVFAVVIRGTDFGELSDWETDALAVADGFHTAGDNAYKDLNEYILQKSESELIENSIFLITGHSLGGAVANILGHELSAAYPASHVFTYTFASPRTDGFAGLSAHTVTNHNIFNVINAQDWVPYVPREWHWRYGHDITFHINQFPENFMNIYNKVTDENSTNISVAVFRRFHAHLADIYMTYLLLRQDNPEAWKSQIRSIYASSSSARTLSGEASGSSMTVEVYTEDGAELVGRVENGVLDTSVSQDVSMEITDEGVRVYMLFDDDYVVQVTGTGQINYALEVTDAESNAVVERKEFTNVRLNDNMALQSAFGSSIQPDEVQLLTVDASGAFTGKIETDGSRTDISTDAPTLSACDLAYESGQISVTAVADNFTDKSVKGNLFAALYENGQLLDCVCLSECETPRGREIRRKLEFNSETSIRNDGNLKAKLFYVDSTTVQSLTPAAEIWHESKE